MSQDEVFVVIKENPGITINGLNSRLTQNVHSIYSNLKRLFRSGLIDYTLKQQKIKTKNGEKFGKAIRVFKITNNPLPENRQSTNLVKTLSVI